MGSRHVRAWLPSLTWQRWRQRGLTYQRTVRRPVLTGCLGGGGRLLLGRGRLRVLAALRGHHLVAIHGLFALCRLLILFTYRRHIKSVLTIWYTLFSISMCQTTSTTSK